MSDQTTPSKLLTIKDIKRPKLTYEERKRAFLWFRAQAIDELNIAQRMRNLNIPIDIPKGRVLMFLEAAREIYPHSGDGDSISIEDIIKGKEPK